MQKVRIEINGRRYLNYGLHCVCFYGTRSEAIQFYGHPMYQIVAHSKEKLRKYSKVSLTPQLKLSKTQNCSVALCAVLLSHASPKSVKEYGK
jgi:hypothetical protein